MKLWMTAAEAASYLSTTRRTLLKYVREGAVKAYSLHGTKRHVWRFLREDLDAALRVINFKSSSEVLE